MRKHLKSLALTVLLAVSAAAPAYAQVEIHHEMRPICDELPAQSVAQGLCEEYYGIKQDVMNKVITDMVAAMSTNAGDDNLRAAMSGEILGLNDELQKLYAALQDVLPGSAWTEDLTMAFDDEIYTTNAAAAYWSHMAYLSTMFLQDSLDMLDAVDDFDKKAEMLQNMADELADHYLEAESVTRDPIDPALMDDVLADFAVDVFVAETLDYCTANLDDDVHMALEKYDPDYRFRTEREQSTVLRESLDEVWYLPHDYLQEDIDYLQTMHDDAMSMLTERGEIMDEEMLYEESGEPFTRIEYSEITSEYNEMYNTLLEVQGRVEP